MDPLIKSQLLYRLSYAPEERGEYQSEAVLSRCNLMQGGAQRRAAGRGGRRPWCTAALWMKPKPIISISMDVPP